MIAYKISKHARILFVGINPHPGSHRRGVPFSNNKMFWYLLNRAGLLDEVESDLKIDETLRHIYDKKFIPKYALNFVLVLPADVALSLTKGFHNAPKLYYDDTVESIPKVIGVKSGFRAAGAQATTR